MKLKKLLSQSIIALCALCFITGCSEEKTTESQKEEVKGELVNFFGEDVVTKSHVDRKKIGEQVFVARDAMATLRDITWSYMEKEIDKIISNNINKIIVLDWILLTHTKYFSMCDYKILVDVSKEMRQERVLVRDKISKRDFDLRDGASPEFKKEDFDMVISEKEEGLTLLKERIR